MMLLDFCRFAQRLGASRGMAWRTWHHERNQETSFEEFVAFWKAARRVEARKARAA